MSKPEQRQKSLKDVLLDHPMIIAVALLILAGITLEIFNPWDNKPATGASSKAEKPQESDSSAEPSGTQLFPSCGEIRREAIEWKNDNFEIDFGPGSCNGTLTFHNPLMPRKQDELPFSRMPVTYTHNEADVIVTVGKPDHKIPNWDRHTPRPGNYNVALVKHDTFVELRLTKQGKSYAMCAPWRPIPLCGEASPQQHW